jgi:hypothetical protein
MQECSGNIINYHAEEEQVEAALEYGAAPSLFTKGLPEALPTEAAVPDGEEHTPPSSSKKSVAVSSDKNTVNVSHCFVPP